MLPVIWLVVSVVFLLIHLVPGDPIQQMLGEGAAATDIAAARHAYGLDVPLGDAVRKLLARPRCTAIWARSLPLQPERRAHHRPAPIPGHCS